MADAGAATAQPTNFTIFDLPSDSKGSIQVNLNIALIVISTVLVFTRIFVRGFMVKALGLDDLLASLAYLILTALSVLEIIAVGVGSGTHMGEIPPDRIPTFFSYLVTLQLLYFIGTGVVRLSIAAFYPRLSQDKVFVRCVYAVAFCTFAITLIAFFFELFECKHVPDLWNIAAPGRQCLDKANEAPMMWSHGAIGILIDVCLVALPIWVIYSKMKFSTKTLQVILVFCVGIFGVVTGIVRLIINVNTDFTSDTTFKMVRVAPWTDLEGHIGLWTSCFPALQPIIRLLSFKLGLRTTISSTHKKSYAAARRGYGASASASAKQSQWTGSHGVRSQGYVSFSDDKEDTVNNRQCTVVGMAGYDDGKDLELCDLETGKIKRDSAGGIGGSGRNVIYKRTDVQVQIAEANDPDVRNQPKKWDAL